MRGIIIPATATVAVFFRGIEIFLEAAVELGEIDEDRVVEELLNIDRAHPRLVLEPLDHFRIERHVKLDKRPPQALWQA